jgi:hypothetical protein
MKKTAAKTGATAKATSKGGFWNGVKTFFRWCFDFPKTHGKSIFDCMFLAIGYLVKVIIGLIAVGIIGACLIGLPALVLHLIGVI